jgi:hypothetical protein
VSKKAKQTDIAETRRIAKAHRQYYVDLKANWPVMEAELDAKIAAAVAEKSKMAEKLRNADNVIAQCDAALARLDREEAAEREAPKVDQMKKLVGRLHDLLESVSEEDAEEILERLLEKHA